MLAAKKAWLNRPERLSFLNKYLLIGYSLFVVTGAPASNTCVRQLKEEVKISDGGKKKKLSTKTKLTVRPHLPQTSGPASVTTRRLMQPHGSVALQELIP